MPKTEALDLIHKVSNVGAATILSMYVVSGMTTRQITPMGTKCFSEYSALLFAAAMSDEIRNIARSKVLANPAFSANR